MKKASLILMKVDLNYCKAYHIDNVLIPKFDKGKKLVNKIKGDIKATLQEDRNLYHHRKMFAIANEACQNGVFEKMISRWDVIDQVFDFQFDIKAEYIQAIRFQYKSDSYSLVYIAKFLFLPFEKEIFPNGHVHHKISSISFAEMDQILFDEFYNKFVEWVALILEVDHKQLEVL
jgi:hypothetical protein